MRLKNYTSETPKERSVGKIISKLVEIGAKNINQEYDEKKIEVHKGGFSDVVEDVSGHKGHSEPLIDSVVTRGSTYAESSCSC